MLTTHLVTLLGREFPVRSSASADKVKSVELLVNRRLNEIGSAMKSSDANLIMMLALLNIAEEMLDFREKAELNSNVGASLQRLINKLESF